MYSTTVLPDNPVIPSTALVMEACEESDTDNMFDFSQLLQLNDPLMAKKCQEFNSSLNDQVQF